MCGIIGYNGKKNAIPILIEGLKKLEYRGYDSAGIAYIKDNNVKIVILIAVIISIILNYINQYITIGSGFIIIICTYFFCSFFSSIFYIIFI